MNRVLPSKSVQGHGQDDTSELTPQPGKCVQGHAQDDTSAVPSVSITRRIDVSLYDLNYEAFRAQHYQVQPHLLRVQWTSDDAAPEHVKHQLTEACRGVTTNGNGACAIHAVFGKPNAKTNCLQ